MSEVLTDRVLRADVVLSGTNLFVGCRRLSARFLLPAYLPHSNSPCFGFFTDLERILNQQVREFVARQAHLCTTLLTNDAEVLKAVRDADTLNDMLARQLDSSQAMSRGLFQHITGIIETPTLARGATAAKTAPAP